MEKHPKWVYLRESDVTDALDEWLLRHFDPKNVDATIEAMAAAQAPDHAGTARAEAARRKIVDCDARLRKYRDALEAGATPLVVAGWMKEVDAERLTAEQELTETIERAPLTEGEIRALIGGVRDGLVRLSGASPEQKKAMYEHMGLRLTYQPERNAVEIESRPLACTQVCVGGGT